MKITFTFFFLFFLTGNVFSQLPGKYSNKGKDFTYTLSLKADSSFSFSRVYFEANSKCEGKWKMLSDKELLLTCIESTLAEKLQGGYMNQRDINVQVLKNNKLKVNEVVMWKSL